MSVQLEFIANLRPVVRDVPGIHPGAAIAHAAHESGWGVSVLARRHHNLFGVKAGESWDGEIVTLPTREWIGNEWIEVDADWRVYPDEAGCVADYSQVIARLYPNAKRNADDGRAFLQGLFLSGPLKWATDPQIYDKVLKIFEVWRLERDEAQMYMGRYDAVVLHHFTRRDAWRLFWGGTQPVVLLGSFVGGEAELTREPGMKFNLRRERGR